MFKNKYKCYLTLPVLLASMACFLPSIAWAVGTLHAIIVADVNDQTIGADQDVAALQKLTSTIRRATCLGGDDIVIHAGRGKRQAISNTLNQLRVSSDDVVMFYYSGHGTNPGGGDRWPTLGVEGQSGGNLLKLSSVKDTLQRKNPRLLITIADACNNISGARHERGRRELDQPAGFKKLFLGYKGTIIASSSIPGQYSFGDPQDGGLFTKQFLEGLNQVQVSSNPDWQAVMNAAKKVIPVNHPQKKQQPHSKVNVVAIGGRRDNNNQWSCPTGPAQGAIGIPTKPPSSSDSPTSYPSCGDGLKRKPGTNQECCSSGGTLHCFND